MYGIHSESSGPDTLLEVFRTIEVSLAIRRDNSKMQASQAWNDIMRNYNCSDEFTEPYNPQQNPTECRKGLFKTGIKHTIADTGCPQKVWYRLAQHIADISNHTAYKSLR